VSSIADVKFQVLIGTFGSRGEVEMESWESSACYSRRKFYPLSNGSQQVGPPDREYPLLSLLDLFASQQGKQATNQLTTGSTG
jgi:hypothetical protein